LELRKKEDSSIHTYIEMLPKDFGNMPIYYDDDLTKLVPGNMREMIESQVSKFEKDFINAHEKLCLQISKKEFLWGWLCVNTRCIYLETSIYDARENIAVAPMLDFLNHSSEAKIKGEFNQSTQCYEITTFSPYQKGQQVFINYGPHDNYLTLLDYGFTIPGNPFAYVLIDDEFFEYNVPGEDEQIMKFKLKLLLDNGFYRLLNLDVDDNANTDRENELALSQHSQSLISKWKSTLTGELEKIDDQNEFEIYNWIYDVCFTKLDKCENKLKELRQ
ncbi:16321_t:CDS:2, partial [Acaulospora colombiana]